MIKTDFSQKVALVTGAASGIGRATALAFADAGADVVVADTQVELGNETVKLIEKKDRRAIFVKCDVSKSDEVKALIDKSVSTFGRIDFAFNNAGIEGVQGFTADCTEENWTRVIDINLKGIWLCMKFQIPYMLKQGSGAIVNCSSVAGLIGFQGVPAYVASKHGVNGLTKTAALEYAKSNIRINSVCPGIIQTPMIDRFTHGEAQIVQQLSAGEPVGRMGKPEEVAQSVIWLCSDQASFITGVPIAVDGGWVAQ